MLLAAAIVVQATGGAFALHQDQHHHAAGKPAQHAEHIPCASYEPLAPDRSPLPAEPDCELCHLLINTASAIAPAERGLLLDAPESHGVRPWAQLPTSSSERDPKRARAPPLG